MADSLVATASAQPCRDVRRLVLAGLLTIGLGLFANLGVVAAANAQAAHDCWKWIDAKTGASVNTHPQGTREGLNPNQRSRPTHRNEDGTYIPGQDFVRVRVPCPSISTPTHRHSTCPSCQAKADRLNAAADILARDLGVGAPPGLAAGDRVRVKAAVDDLDACEKSCRARTATGASRAASSALGGATRPSEAPAAPLPREPPRAGEIPRLKPPTHNLPVCAPNERPALVGGLPMCMPPPPPPVAHGPMPNIPVRPH